MRVLLPLAGLFMLLVSSVHAADVLSLAEAESIAIQRDADRARLALEAEAQSQRAVAAGSLPDPEVRLGVTNLPVDSFALDAEPMTQVVLGIRQMLPPGDTRQFRSLRGEQQAEAMAAMADERAAKVRFAVRDAWSALALAELARREIAASRAKVDPLIAAAESRYATGGGRQGDYLAARLKLDRLQERELEASERATAARAMLERWQVKAPATLSLDLFPQPAPLDELLEYLPLHPLVHAADARIAANTANVALAEAAFGPQWGLDFSYGNRRGVDAFGVDRPDFVSAMVTMSLPLFTGNRQGRELSAAKRETRAAEHGRDDVLRDLASRLEIAWYRHRDVSRQLELLESRLLPSARQSREAVLQSYADNTASFAELAAAEVDLLDVALRRLELQKRQQLLRAEIRYLTGEPQ